MPNASRMCGMPKEELFRVFSEYAKAIPIDEDDWRGDVEPSWPYITQGSLLAVRLLGALLRSSFAAEGGLLGTSSRLLSTSFLVLHLLHFLKESGGHFFSSHCRIGKYLLGSLNKQYQNDLIKGRDPKDYTGNNRRPRPRSETVRRKEELPKQVQGSAK